MTEPAAKRAILARRSKFVAAAMASGVMSCTPTPAPLSSVCLSVMPDEADSGVSDTADVATPISTIDSTATSPDSFSAMPDSALDSQSDVHLDTRPDSRPDSRSGARRDTGVRPLVCLNVMYEE